MENKNLIEFTRVENCVIVHLNKRQTSAFKFGLRKALYNTQDEMRTKTGIARYTTSELLEFDIDTWEKTLEDIAPAMEITLTYEIPSADGL